MRRIGSSLFGLLSKFLVTLPGGFAVREQIARILRKGFVVARSGGKISEVKAEKKYAVSPFQNNHSYIITVARKK
jgi:hypothetical protein